MSIFFYATASANAQPAPEVATGPTVPEDNEVQPPVEAQETDGLFDIIFSGGLIGALIVFFLCALSIAGMALVVEHVMTIREGVLMPPGLDDGVAQQLGSGNLGGAVQVCQNNPSVLGFVLKAGLAEVEGGWNSVEKAMEDATAEQSARLLRKVEYLSVLGNIAPMVGLLGTVIGMIFAFQEVANTQGAARASELASGIYQALITTVGGLLVAIPSLGAYAIFRNRVDQLIAETAYKSQRAMLPIKRLRNKRNAPQAPAPPK